MRIVELYPRYFDEIVRFARSMTRDEAAAEDVTQETFVKALQNATLIEGLGDAQARSWLYTTAKRLVIDQARRIKRAPPISAESAVEDDLTPVLVASVMDALNPDDRELLSLRCFAGLNSVEIGQILGVPAPTVRTRLRTAVRKLRVAYYADEEERK